MERHKSFNQQDSFEEELFGINRQINWIQDRSNNEAERKKTTLLLFSSLHTSAILSQLCVGLPDKGHYQGVFGVLLETAGTETHVHDSALYHRHADLMGSHREGFFSVTNSTCRAAAVV